MAETGYDSHPTKKPGWVKKALIVGSIGAATVAGVKVASNERSGTPYQTFAAHEISNIESWQQRINDQITSGGQLELADLKIRVESGVLYGRYSPIVRNNDDTDYGNVAIEFNPGAEYNINDAIIIHGETADPNDPNGDRWAWVDGSNLGLQYDFYINVGKPTEGKVEMTEQRSVDFSQINPNGDVYFKDANGANQLVQQSMQAAPVQNK